MRLFVVATILFGMARAFAQTPAALWDQLKAKRHELAGAHQEFEASTTVKGVAGTATTKWRAGLDLAQERWREQEASGSGIDVTIYDGRDLLKWEPDGDEYVRLKQPKSGSPEPFPYELIDPDWKKALEVSRVPCTMSEIHHQCVILELPLKPSTEAVGNGHKRLQGVERVMLDLDTGLILSARTREILQHDTRTFQRELLYVLKRMSYGSAPEAGLLKVPSAGMREVKELSRWTAPRIRKMLLGKPAPELSATDLRGKPVSLAALKGKTVLLDFFTTWCPPCRADGPALDKLHKRYSEKGLEIIAVSVDEERAIVEKFLTEHSHAFPIVLTTENEIPRPYQVGAFPTYIVVDQDGTVAAVSDGDRGFGDLRKTLKKAGLDTD